MVNQGYKAKRFLPQILTLVLVSIILVALISTSITINMFKSHMNEHISQIEKEYINSKKKDIYKDVHYVNETIKFQMTKIEKRLKERLKERVQIAIDVTNIIYNQYKNRLPKEKIKQKVSMALATIRFNENRGYYFMYDNTTKVLFGHPMKKFIGKNMTSYTDVRGRNLMQTDAKILENNTIGFNTIYFNKPNNPSIEYPKITCITKFEPLNIVIGTGEYLDVIEKQIKAYILEKFSTAIYNDKNKYLFIVDIHDFKGGENFATTLLNSNKPELVGKFLSTNESTSESGLLTKEYLKYIQDKKEGYSKYMYKKPSSQIPELKMSYILLQKDWNWLIGSGFYFDDLQKEIEKMETSLKNYTRDTINKALIWVIILSVLAIVITSLISLSIDKTIKVYTNKIINYEEHKREQERLLIQQSKMASMGEMMESIAHQWRQPLSIISTSSSGIQMQQEYGTLSNEQLHEMCENITKSANHLNQTVNDFRNFFKKDKKRVDFNLKECFNKTLDLLVSVFKNRDIQIIQNIEDITIHGFENELVQVFMNILNNAKDEFELKSGKKLIFIHTYRENECVIISIKDNAGGISKKILPKIFDSHFTTKEKRNGTGIGLHMSKRIIQESFNGSIQAVNTTFSHEGVTYQGVNFIITLKR